jgi:hypothetical protein
MNWIWSAKQSTRQLRCSGAAAYLDLAGPGSGSGVAAGTGVTLPYLAAAFGAASALPGISGAAAFTTSSANFRWLVSSCSAKS